VNAGGEGSYDIEFDRRVLFGWDWVIRNRHYAAVAFFTAFQTTVELVLDSNLQ